jgi:transcriptional regulator with XRE-family HTH domain
MKYKMAAAAIKMHYDTQKAFGEKLGLSELEVSQIINGRKKLSDADRAKWSKVLQTPLRLLFPEKSAKKEG